MMNKMKDKRIDGHVWVFRIDGRIIAKTYTQYTSQLIWDGLMQARIPQFKVTLEVEKH
ncbi:MAG: hypothetical protein M1503_11525 [Thaumarchaeota archaeon]|nr:hypothetical protein [Nitrososphaerota archaeon]MCL5318873.1 hypothetical protein [Nitrososphaerota archaeon]